MFLYLCWVIYVGKLKKNSQHSMLAHPLKNKIYIHTSWSVNSKIEGSASFMKWVPWILTLSLTRKSHQINVSWPRKRRKTEISEGLPPAALSIIPFCRLRLWTTVCGLGGKSKTISQPPHDQVEATLLKDVRICQEQDSDHAGPNDASLNPGISGASV